MKDIKTLTVNEIENYINSTELTELLEIANKLRKKNSGFDFQSCSILNARSGHCSEDCAWCSQSKFHKSTVEVYPLVDTNNAVSAAKENADLGIKRFSLVTSGRAMSESETLKAAELYNDIRSSVNIKLCASMGLLNKEKLQKLYDAGVTRYHCNIETSPSFFPKLCTTHSFQDKIDTIKAAQEVSMQICSGGIIGMGETMADRVEMAVTLNELGVKSIPINILNPIKGTALENQTPLEPHEILRTIAMFRIVNPYADIRLAGGRATLGDTVAQALSAGVNGAIMGDLLTTLGASVEQDKKTILEAGFKF